MKDVYFTIATPLGCAIHATKTYWEYIVKVKHPSMLNKEDIVKETLKQPDKIYKSTVDESVYLYYRKIDRLYCIIVKHKSLKEGFLITAYPTDKIKEGELIWKR
jgi:hypothetical protein